ncbi:MAG: DNA polymerase III subunit alpha, partial [Spirochaetia bacterium]|nr:DNA polymerase III subunit alpha [Spirochaetia bacterium]
EMKKMDDWSLPEKLEMEKSLLGFYISGHPLDAYDQAIKERVTVNTAKQELLPFGRPINSIAMVSSIRPFITQKGTTMGFLQLTDKNATFDATLFPKLYEQYRDQLKVDAIYGFIGKFDNSRGNDKISFLIEQIFEDPNMLAAVAVSRCHIALEKSFCSTEHVSQLRDICLSYGGSCELFLHFQEEGEDTNLCIACGREFAVRYSEAFVDAVKENPAILNIWFD